jgi:hypothetical protein
VGSVGLDEGQLGRGERVRSRILPTITANFENILFASQESFLSLARP